jgi:hypothetical protein
MTSRYVWILLVLLQTDGAWGQTSRLTDRILMELNRQSIQHFMVDRRINHIGLGLYSVQTISKGTSHLE